MSEHVTALYRLDDPFSGAVTRLENWPEGLVLWHGGVIVWRSWGPPAPGVPMPEPSEIAGLRVVHDGRIPAGTLVLSIGGKRVGGIITIAE